MAIGATRAYFSDTVTSNNNTFNAASLDLNLDGGNINVVKFSAVDMKPGDIKTGAWRINNVGTIDGYLDLENITKSSDEFSCTEPESINGDITCDNPGTGQGDLLSLLNIQLFVDPNNNNIFEAGDTLIYNGPAGGLAAGYDQNLLLPAGSSNYLAMVVGWATTVNDNLGQTDRMNLGLTFELGQTSSQ